MYNIVFIIYSLLFIMTVNDNILFFIFFFYFKFIFQLKINLNLIHHDHEGRSHKRN